jgi:hypothetical protein
MAPALRAIHGTRIARVRALGLSRALLFDLSADDEWGTRAQLALRIDLRPAVRPATLFKLPGERPIDSIGTARAAAPSTPEEVPPAKPLSLLDLPGDPPDTLIEGITPSGGVERLPEHTRAWLRIKSVAAGLVGAIDGVDPPLARILLRSVGGELSKVWPHLVNIGTLIREKRFEWNAYELPEEDEAGRGLLYPVPLGAGTKPTFSNDCMRAFSYRAERTSYPALIAYLRRVATQAARRELRKLERLGTHLTKDIEEAGRSKEYRYYGNLLVTFRHQLKPGMETISVPDFSGSRSVTIRLDPARGPDANIRSYFTRAKKGEKGMLIIRNRKRAVEREIAGKRRFIEKLSRIDRPDELIAHISQSRRTPGPRRGAEDAPHFRRFQLDARHTVYVGRNRAENDTLTHRFAAPGDLWFHAQGVSGSHVILKGATPSTPKGIIEKAAAVAAYFSKSRHSGTVPVVCVEKRYVRKPRKSPPGTATYIRGKTLFVTPGLPEEEKQGRDR